MLDVANLQTAADLSPPARVRIGVPVPRGDSDTARERVAQVALVDAPAQLVKAIGLDDCPHEVAADALLLRQAFGVVSKVGVHDQHALARSIAGEVDLVRHLRFGVGDAPEVEPLAGQVAAVRYLTRRAGILERIRRTTGEEGIVRQNNLGLLERIQDVPQIGDLQPRRVVGPEDLEPHTGLLERRRGVYHRTGHRIPITHRVLDEAAAVLIVIVQVRVAFPDVQPLVGRGLDPKTVSR